MEWAGAVFVVAILLLVVTSALTQHRNDQHRNDKENDRG